MCGGHTCAAQGAQWLSGRVLDSRPKGRGFEPHRRHCVVSLSKNINPSLVLVQPRKTRPFITERLLMGRKESNLTNMCGSREGGGQGVRTPPPPENYKNIGFLNNTGPDPLKITKLPSQHSMLGHHRLASETPFKWRVAGGSVMTR